MSNIKNLWWGYLHINTTLHAKRYFDKLDIEEAEESPFCRKIVGPFKATDIDEALSIVKQLTSFKIIL